MRLRHNKKRNTAFVYEALVRELTKSVIKNNKNKQNKIISVMKEHFSKNSVLNRELDLYKSIYETRDIEKRLAEKIILEAKERYASLDKTKLFREQSDLINTINKTLSNKIFQNFVPNYKSLASVYSIFNDGLPIKDRVLLEENIVEQMSQSAGVVEEANKKPIDNIVYKSFVNKFNEEYTDVLSENQKNLLTRYISSFSDNGLELKAYLNEELGTLKKKLLDSKNNEEISNDEEITLKIQKVYDILESYKDKKEIDVDLLETVLKTQDLVSQIQGNENQ